MFYYYFYYIRDFRAFSPVAVGLNGAMGLKWQNRKQWRGFAPILPAGAFPGLNGAFWGEALPVSVAVSWNPKQWSGFYFFRYFFMACEKSPIGGAFWGFGVRHGWRGRSEAPPQARVLSRGQSRGLNIGFPPGVALEIFGQKPRPNLCQLQQT